MNSAVQTFGAIIVSTVVVLGFVGICGVLIFHPVADTSNVNTMFGGLSAGFALVIGYWMGSSAGSRAKDAALAAAVQAPVGR